MKKIELQEWALAAEIIGGIAVLVTLIFLVLETRENTNAIQAQTYQSLTAELNEHRRSTISPEIVEIRLKYIDSGLGSLSENKRYKLMVLSEAKWGIYESAYYARERGILGEAEWFRFDNAICRNLKLDRTLWYPEEVGINILNNFPGVGIATNITPMFRDYVENLCK